MSSTQYLSDNSGDAHTLYNEMRRIAGFYARRAASHPTVGPTMLVHEAWLRLLRQPSRSRTHYLALAARAMRHFVIDYVRGKMAHKRDGGEAAVPAACGQTDRELSMDLERALERYEATLDTTAALHPILSLQLALVVDLEVLP